MRIEGPYSRPNVSRKKLEQRSGFSVSGSDDGETSRTESRAPVAAMSELDAILALQAVDDPLMAKRKAVRHGQHLLDALDQVKADLLTGQIGEGRIHRLAALVSKARELSEPELDSLLDEIELRARVELAKLGH